MTDTPPLPPLPDLSSFDGHTPGPWDKRDYRADGKAGNAQPGSIWIDCVAYTKNGRSLGGTVAETYARGCNGPVAQEANARLIAAAPALLAHHRALQAENERLRADLQQSRVAIDTYVAALAASRKEG